MAEDLTVLARDAQWKYYDQGKLDGDAWKPPILTIPRGQRAKPRWDLATTIPKPTCRCPSARSSALATIRPIST
jgi:hypothetical protein